MSLLAVTLWCLTWILQFQPSYLHTASSAIQPVNKEKKITVLIFNNDDDNDNSRIMFKAADDHVHPTFCCSLF